MRQFFITAVYFNCEDIVEEVCWGHLDGDFDRFLNGMQVVDAHRVFEALDRGDHVAMLFTTPFGYVIGEPVRRMISQNGYETLAETRYRPGFSLRDLPSTMG